MLTFNIYSMHHCLQGFCKVTIHFILFLCRYKSERHETNSFRQLRPCLWLANWHWCSVAKLPPGKKFSSLWLQFSMNLRSFMAVTVAQSVAQFTSPMTSVSKKDLCLTNHAVEDLLLPPLIKIPKSRSRHSCTSKVTEIPLGEHCWNSASAKVRLSACFGSDSIKLYPHRLQVVQTFNRKITFDVLVAKYNSILHHYQHDPQVLKNFWFSDELFFHVAGRVSRHNCRISAKPNSAAIVAYDHYSQTLVVKCALPWLDHFKISSAMHPGPHPPLPMITVTRDYFETTAGDCCRSTGKEWPSWCLFFNKTTLLPISPG